MRFIRLWSSARTSCLSYCWRAICLFSNKSADEWQNTLATLFSTNKTDYPVCVSLWVCQQCIGFSPSTTGDRHLYWSDGRLSSRIVTSPPSWYVSFTLLIIRTVLWWLERDVVYLLPVRRFLSPCQYPPSSAVAVVYYQEEREREKEIRRVFFQYILSLGRAHSKIFFWKGFLVWPTTTK